MPYRRGDVIAVPYDYSDLTGGKVRPAVVVSSDAYNLARPDVVAAGISSQIARVGPYDHLLADWAAAGLRYPSLVRGRLLTLEQNLIRRSVGRLSPGDVAACEEKLATFLLSDIAIADYLLTRIDLAALPGRIVQALAEKGARASAILAAQGNPAIDLEHVRKILTSSVNP
jgi:mRNA interferase MazF